jgi:hypothetical protein
MHVQGRVLPINMTAVGRRQCGAILPIVSRLLIRPNTLKSACSYTLVGNQALSRVLQVVYRVHASPSRLHQLSTYRFCTQCTNDMYIHTPPARCMAVMHSVSASHISIARVQLHPMQGSRSSTPTISLHVLPHLFLTYMGKSCCSASDSV